MPKSRRRRKTKKRKTISYYKKKNKLPHKYEKIILGIKFKANTHPYINFKTSRVSKKEIKYTEKMLKMWTQLDVLL